MNHCQAPYRLPEGFYERLEADFADRLTPEQFAVGITTIVATDHDCGEPAVATVNHKGRTIHVCAWHEEQHRTLIASLCVQISTPGRLLKQASSSQCPAKRISLDVAATEVLRINKLDLRASGVSWVTSPRRFDALAFFALRCARITYLQISC